MWLKTIVIFQGIPKELNLHWSLLKLNARILPNGKRIPDTVKNQEDYFRWCSDNKISIIPGVSLRFRYKVPSVDTDKDKENYFQFLEMMSSTEVDRVPRGYKYHIILDLDSETFLSVPAVWSELSLKKYTDHPFNYKEITPEEQKRIINRLKGYIVIHSHERLLQSHYRRPRISHVRTYKRRLRKGRRRTRTAYPRSVFE